MAEVFFLPQMGQTMTEGTILKWLKQEGESVEGWEGVVEMMTDKINMEVEPQIKGTLRKILAPEGATVPVGGPLAIIGSPDEDICALMETIPVSGTAAVSSAPAPDSLTAIAAEPTGNGAAEHPTAADPFPNVTPRAREAALEGGVTWKSMAIEGTGFEGAVVERDVLAYLHASPEAQVLSTPLAAKIAADEGVALEGVAGSGPRGRVRAEDVRRAAARRQGPAIEAREIPLRGMRKVIAGRLAASYHEAVHVPLRVDVDMSAAAALRAQLKSALEASGGRLTYTDLLAAAAVQALIANPLLNATLEQEVVRVHPGVHLGIAVALDDGLTVPVVRDAHNLRLPELSQAIEQAASGARAGRLPPDAYAGGTFTLTNLGQYGVDSFDPIINPPQVAILGTGRIQERVVAVDGSPGVRPMMTVTLTFDHRALDGAPGSKFLAAIKELLENPARLLL